MAFVTITVDAVQWVPYAVGAVGVAAALIGLTLVLNLNASADHLTSLVTTKKVWGVDYSQSVIARPFYVRLLGAGFVVVGIMFATIAATGKVSG